MVVYRYRNDFFGFFLSHYIFIQACLDLMRCRNIFDVEYRFGTFGFLFLLEFLLVGDAAVSLEVCQIHKADVGESVLSAELVQIARIIQHALVVELAHSLHGLVHAVIANADMIRQLEHSAGFALRSAADEADILVLAAVLFVLCLFLSGIFTRSIRYLCVLAIFFVIFFFVQSGLCFLFLRNHFSIIIIVIICHVILLFVYCSVLISVSLRATSISGLRPTRIVSYVIPSASSRFS